MKLLLVACALGVVLAGNVNSAPSEGADGNSSSGNCSSAVQKLPKDVLEKLQKSSLLEDIINVISNAFCQIGYPSGGESASTNGTQSQGTPANETQAQGSPADAAQLQSAAAQPQSAAADGASADGAPSDGAPSDGAPADGAPAQPSPSK